MPVVYILTPYFYSFSAVNPPNTPIAIMTPLIPIEKQTSDYECTHQMGLFDTHFVQFGQVLPVSGQKLLVTSN